MSAKIRKSNSNDSDSSPTTITAVPQPFFSNSQSSVRQSAMSMDLQNICRLCGQVIPALPPAAQPAAGPDRAEPPVDVPDWARDAAPPGWTISQMGVKDTKMWEACSGGSDREWMAIAKCQQCDRVVQTPSGRGGAPSEHMHQHWHKKRKKDTWASGGIYCSTECEHEAQTSS